MQGATIKIVLNEVTTRSEFYVTISSEILSVHLTNKDVAFETSLLCSVLLCF